MANETRQTEGAYFEGRWNSDVFGSIELREEAGQVRGRYTGGGGGTLTGQAIGTRLDFRWRDDSGAEGEGFLRAVSHGRTLAGLRHSDAEKELKQSLVMTRVVSTAATPPADASADMMQFKYKGYDLALQGRCEEAIVRLERALELYRQAGRDEGTSHLMRDNYKIDEAGIITRLLHCYYALGDGAWQGEYFYEKLLTRLLDAVEIRSALLRVEYLEAVNRAAPDTASQLSNYIELWRKRLLGDAARIEALEKSQDFFRKLVQFFAAHGNAEEALAASELARARAFADLLARRGEDFAQAETAPSETEGARRGPATAPPFCLEPVLRLAAQQRATLVEYFVNERQLYIWVVQPSGSLSMRAVELAQLGRPLAEVVAETRRALGACSRDAKWLEQPAPGAASLEGLRLLHQLLIEPVADLLPTEAALPVVFVPHGPLFMVPFAALLSESEYFLIEDHTPVTAPSLHVWMRLQGRARHVDVKGDDALVVGNPKMPTLRRGPDTPPEPLEDLPHALEEAKEVAKILGTAAVTGEAATKVALLHSMASRRIIHLATHGLLDDFGDDGVPGAIALAPSTDDDGLLTPSEIVRLKLAAELIVLSACNTGRGRITGDGVVGLTRAFIVAGAAGTVVSLWAVGDDSTRHLMTEFYERRRHVRGQAAALREAMLALLKRKGYEDPIHWAAFTFSGDTS